MRAGIPDRAQQQIGNQREVSRRAARLRLEALIESRRARLADVEKLILVGDLEEDPRVGDWMRERDELEALIDLDGRELGALHLADELDRRGPRRV